MQKGRDRIRKIQTDRRRKIERQTGRKIVKQVEREERDTQREK